MAAIRDALSQEAVAPQALKVDEVARQLQVSKETAVRAIKNGHLKAADVSERSGGSNHRADYRIRQEWVDEYMDRKSQNPGLPLQPKRVKQKHSPATEFIK